MKIAVSFKSLRSGKREYIGEVIDCVDKDIFVDVDDKGEDLVDKKDKDVKCQLRIVVDNVLYCWEDVPISFADSKSNAKYKLVVETNPQVFNRRKYPRMPLSNSCSIKIKNEEDVYRGRMVNVSANGFAFAVRDDAFVDMKGKDVIVNVKDFDVIEDEALEGCIIRSSNNDGEYVVGCRMPQDSKAIKEYVNQNYCE